MRFTVALLFVLFVVLCGCSENARVAAAVDKLADAPSKVVLYSLDPTKLHDKSTHNDSVFHGFDILGRAEINDSGEQRALLRALARGVRENDASLAACFDPRHALHIEQSGRSIDFTICFECLQVEARGFHKRDGFFTSASPQPTFDESLRRHHLPIAPN